LSDAVIVVVTADDTGVVLTVNIADVALAGTTTDAGTVVDPELLDKSTVMPPVGAGPFKVTVPVDDIPPATVVGFKLSEFSAGGETVRIAVNVAELNVAPMVTGVVAATGNDLTVNVAVVVLAGICTVAGTVAEPELLES